MEQDDDYLENFNYKDWIFPFLIYSGAIVALYAAYKLEYRDLYHPKDNQEPKNGQGAAYAEGNPKSRDDFHTLLAKIRISSRYDESSVYWRRSIIFSVLLSFSLLLIIFRRFPTAYELLASFILIYFFIYLFLIFYQETISKHATKQVNRATEALIKLHSKFNRDTKLTNLNTSLNGNIDSLDIKSEMNTNKFQTENLNQQLPSYINFSEYLQNFPEELPYSKQSSVK